MRSFNCPICGKIYEIERLSDQPSFPFCSDRCKLVDLGRWIDGSYLISRELNEDEQIQLEEMIEQRLSELELDEEA